MTLTEFRQRLLNLHRSERGTALTEFMFFLPIWIIVFIGIINLGQVGIFSTKVQLQAQRELWKQAIEHSNIGVTDVALAYHMSPRSAAPVAGAGYTNVAGLPNSDMKTVDLFEAAAPTVAMELEGHYGEAQEKAQLSPAAVLMPSTLKEYPIGIPKKVMDQTDAARYPHRLLNDTLTAQSWSGGATAVIGAVIGASGLAHSIGAGIRYGSVFSNKTESATLMGRAGSYSAGAHFDTLVAPKALTGYDGSDLTTFGIAWILFKLDTKYGPYFQFGKQNWGGGDGTSDRGNPDTSHGDGEEEIQKECDRRSANPRHDDGSEPCCGGPAYDPDADDNDSGLDDTKPQWLRDCEDL